MVSIVKDGRCTDAMVGATATTGVADANTICNTYNTLAGCNSNALCMWRTVNDTCYCSFVGCSCGDPAQNVRVSAEFESSTMVLVIVPVMLMLFMVRTPHSAPREYEKDKQK